MISLFAERARAVHCVQTEDCWGLYCQQQNLLSSRVYEGIYRILRKFIATFSFLECLFCVIFNQKYQYFSISFNVK
jgi:hypothetical protein